MAITKYTSPPNVLLVKDINITTAEVYVTIKQSSREITLSGDSLSLAAVGSDTQITFYLTQEQTALFDLRNYAKIQVNWIIGGHRFATEIKNVTVYENLLNEVIT